jgi:hypothetical protein
MRNKIIAFQNLFQKNVMLVFRFQSEVVQYDGKMNSQMNRVVLHHNMYLLYAYNPVELEFPMVFLDYQDQTLLNRISINNSFILSIESIVKNELTYFFGIGFVRRLTTIVTMPEMKKSTIEKYRKLNRTIDGRLSKCSS